MEFVKCPECTTFGRHDDGKCLKCDHISSVRASINALYSSKKSSIYQTVELNSTNRLSEPNYANIDFLTTAATSSAFDSFSDDSCPHSSAHFGDHGSSHDGCDF